MKLGKKYIHIKKYIFGIYLKDTKYMKYVRYKCIRYLKKHNSFDKYLAHLLADEVDKMARLLARWHVKLKIWHALALWRTKLKN